MNPWRFVLFSLLLFATSNLFADSPPWNWDDDLVPDLGFDLDQAQVLHVTTLEGEGRGSLRDALWKKGPRIIVFDVGGVIDLDHRSVKIENDQVIVAGQTAPGPGITLIRGGIVVEASQVLIQHLAVRPGSSTRTKADEWTPDGFSTGSNCKDVWVDQCSFTWSVDENLSASSYKAPEGDPARRIYFRNCIVAEALNDSIHPKGPHSKGTLIMDGTQQVAIVGCLYGANVERNPLFKQQTSGVVVNCLISGPGQRSIHSYQADPITNNAKVSIEGNFVKFSPHTKKSSAVIEGQADWYAKDNMGTDAAGEPIPVVRKGEVNLGERPVWPEGLEPVPASSVPEKITANVGARPAKRDPIDARIVEQALAGTLVIIDSQEDVEGYPSYSPVESKVEVPDQNRRDWLRELAADLMPAP